MKRFTPLILFVLCACARPEIPVPTCDNIQASRVGNEIHLIIHSTSDHVTLHSDLGYSMDVPSSYFGCVSVSLDFGETITVEDNGRSCEIVVMDKPVR